MRKDHDRDRRWFCNRVMKAPVHVSRKMAHGEGVAVWRRPTDTEMPRMENPASHL